MKLTILANFGGPRSLEEIEPFLRELLTDRDVIRTRMPRFVHDWVFGRAATERAGKVAADYALIGGKSPIFEETEAVAAYLREQNGGEVIAFHRYLPATHPQFLNRIGSGDWEEIYLFPLFPQFSYATTGSIARWLEAHLPQKLLQRLRWIKSYSVHPAYLRAFQSCIQECLQANQLREEETALLFSAHGLPRSFIESGDLYERECERTFVALKGMFPQALSRLSYQSKFGPGEWLRPYTDEMCKDAATWSAGRKQVVLIPLSFTSDHIETLFEVEKLYLPLVEEKGLKAYRCPALGQRSDWLRAIEQILAESEWCANQMLIFRK